MSVPTTHKDIQLPGFNADKDNVNARAWITTEDMCINPRAAADGDLESCT